METASRTSSFMPKRCIPRTSRPLGSMIGDSTTIVARKILGDHLSAIGPGVILHDNGCGTGTVTREVLDTYPELISSSPATLIHAADINATFIEELKAYVASHGWGSTVHPAVMAAEDLKLPESSVTHSFTNFLISGAKVAPKAAAESLRTLVPGGVAVTTIFVHLPHTKALDRRRERLYGEHGMSHIKPEWSELSHLENLLKEAGFVSCSFYSEAFGAECIREGFKVGEEGRLRVSLAANVVTGWKEQSRTASGGFGARAWLLPPHVVTFTNWAMR